MLFKLINPQTADWYNVFRRTTYKIYENKQTKRNGNKVQLERAKEFDHWSARWTWEEQRRAKTWAVTNRQKGRCLLQQRPSNVQWSYVYHRRGPMPCWKDYTLWKGCLREGDDTKCCCHSIWQENQFFHPESMVRGVGSHGDASKKENNARERCHHSPTCFRLPPAIRSPPHLGLVSPEIAFSCTALHPANRIERAPCLGARRQYTCARRYANGHVGSAEVDLARGATPTATLGVAYADGLSRLRRGRAAVSTRWHSCSARVGTHRLAMA
jgi:hypothetical protein